MNLFTITHSIIILSNCFANTLYGTFETKSNLKQLEVSDFNGMNATLIDSPSVPRSEQTRSKDDNLENLRFNRTICGVELRGESVLLAKAVSIFAVASLVCFSPFWFDMLCADSNFAGVYTLLAFIYIGTLIQGAINYLQFIVADNHENRSTCSVVTAAIAIFLSIYLFIGTLVVSINDDIGKKPICNAFPSNQLLSLENAYGNFLLGLPAFLQTFTFDPRIMDASDLSCCVRQTDQFAEDY